MQTIQEAALREVAKAICKSRTCEGINCCQWPCNGGKHGDWNRSKRVCPVEAGGYDDAAQAAWDRIEEMRDWR